MSQELSHLDEAGRARMVDVGDKDVTQRRAQARAQLRMTPATAQLLVDGRLPKGEALGVARVAGIMAAKRTPELIPLCHTVALASVEVDVAVDVEAGLATVIAATRATDRTGVEMEALVAVSIASLTLYDMVKAVERGVVLERVELLHKSGGVGGEWQRGT
ncbi:MAG: cyclic pyranopterin monophosphate synthase MoaC [Euzebyaceae bacterium]|jgi:cyclic pyranopterin phosphate synthase|nr:cyclic pyranopterin monophosphate synthase MoaC [Euzebyaceae bacterium]